MSEIEYEVFARDSSGAGYSQVDNFTNMRMALKFNKVSRWIMKLPYDADLWALWSTGGGIKVRRNDASVLSGQALWVKRKWTKKGNVMEVGGADDKAYLAFRLAYPEVTGDFASQAYDVRTGPFETVAKEYVDYNLCSNALSQRQVSGFTNEADAAAGGSVTGRARFPVLIELLAELALKGGDMGFEVIDKEFQVFTPEDKTGSVVFSEGLGNILAVEQSINLPKANYILCGGGGVGVARMIEELGDSASIVQFGRIEYFRDRRDTTDAGELLETINEELDKLASIVQFKVAPTDLSSMAFMDDYQVGDKVGIVFDDVSTTGIVREADVTVKGKDCETVKPIIGTPESSLEEAFARQLRDIQAVSRRVDALERV